MGKSAKIRKLNELCKAKGLGRFYKGKGRLVKRDLSSGWFDIIMSRLLVEPGQIIHDCDGFNHVVRGLANVSDRMIYKRGNNTYAKHTYYKFIDQFEFEDGRWSCGCPCCVESARSREDIEAWTKAYYLSEAFATWYAEEVPERVLRMKSALLAGEHICDERGVMLEKFREK